MTTIDMANYPKSDMHPARNTMVMKGNQMSSREFYGDIVYHVHHHHHHFECPPNVTPRPTPGPTSLTYVPEQRSIYSEIPLYHQSQTHERIRQLRQFHAKNSHAFTRNGNQFMFSCEAMDMDPTDITIMEDGNQLFISGEKNGNPAFSYMIDLPNDLDLKSLSSSLQKNGILITKGNAK